MRKGMGTKIAVIATALLVTACSQKRVHEDPIIEQGDRVATADDRASAERSDALADRVRAEEGRDDVVAEALADCAPAICEAVLRGEVSLGMNEVQVLAATGTTEAAWRIRRAGEATVLTPRSLERPPRDAIADVSMVRLADGRASTIAYREAQGMRVVESPEQATREGRARALAELLIAEGDDLAARGDFTGALNRFDRADILSDDPILDYKIAAALDKQLRPIEALIQYRLFLHRLEIERIRARGEASAMLADAIAQARQRVLILERETR